MPDEKRRGVGLHESHVRHKAARLVLTSGLERV